MPALAEALAEAAGEAPAAQLMKQGETNAPLAIMCLPALSTRRAPGKISSDQEDVCFKLDSDSRSTRQSPVVAAATRTGNTVFVYRSQRAARAD